MSSGPIEFLGESEPHEVPKTEFGGNDGLIQPSPEEVGLIAADGMLIGHDLGIAETASVMMRRASVPLSGRAQVTGEDLEGGVVVDPVTGRVVVEGVGAENKGVEGKWGSDHGLSDLKPGR